MLAIKNLMIMVLVVLIKSNIRNKKKKTLKQKNLHFTLMSNSSKNNLVVTFSNYSKFLFNAFIINFFQLRISLVTI